MTRRLGRDRASPPAADPADPGGRRLRSALGALACLYRQREAVLRHVCVLAASLRTRDTAAGLRAFEHLCAALLVADELVALVAPAAGDGDAGAPATAVRLRRWMLDEATPWIAAARWDLPGAAELLGRFLAPAQGEPERG